MISPYGEVIIDYISRIDDDHKINKAADNIQKLMDWAKSNLNTRDYRDIYCFMMLRMYDHSHVTKQGEKQSKLVDKLMHDRDKLIRSGEFYGRRDKDNIGNDSRAEKNNGRNN